MLPSARRPLPAEPARAPVVTSRLCPISARAPASGLAPMPSQTGYSSGQAVAGRGSLSACRAEDEDSRPALRAHHIVCVACLSDRMSFEKV